MDLRQVILLGMLALAAGFAGADTAPDLRLSLELPKWGVLTLQPDTYGERELATFRAMSPEDQASFLEKRRERLGKILKILRVHVLEDAQVIEPSRLGKHLVKFLEAVDARLFRTGRLLIDKSNVRGKWLTGQIVGYWGFLDKSLGFGIEISLVRKFNLDTRRGETRLVLDLLKVEKALVPIPLVSLAGRYVHFHETDGAADSGIEVFHLPGGPVLTSGENHLGIGAALGISFPPPPFSTVSGFVAKISRHPLLNCDHLLTTTDEISIGGL